MQSTRNPIVQPLLTDLYQITMTYGYWRQGKHEDPAIFELFFRKPPFQGEFVIFAGLGDCLEFIKNFSYSLSDIEYLKKELPGLDTAFFDYMLNITCKDIVLRAIPEGALAFPRVPLIVVEGPLAVCQLLETTLLNQVNYASLVCTNAARHRVAAGEKSQLLEFGLRRAQGADGAMTASKYSYIGGLDGTSNLLAGKIYGIPVKGTMAHSFVSSFDPQENLIPTARLIDSVDGTQKGVDLSQLALNYVNEVAGKVPGIVRNEVSEGEFKSFVAFAAAFPKGFLVLIDTYDALKSGLINFCGCALALHSLGYKPVGVRIDSGDLAYLSKKIRQVFQSVAKCCELPWFEKLVIVASNDINEDIIYSLKEQHHEIDAFGIGTNLVTCQKQPALGCVYKLVQLRGTPRIKLSQDIEKLSIPGQKRAFRFYGQDGVAINDYIILDDEPEPKAGMQILCRHPMIENIRAYVVPTRVEQLHSIYWKDGSIQQPIRTVQELKAEVARSLTLLREDHKRHLNPTPYKVSLSEKMYKFFHDLWLQSAPIGQLK